MEKKKLLLTIPLKLYDRLDEKAKVTSKSQYVTMLLMKDFDMAESDL